jgi:hypothetical protein
MSKHVEALRTHPAGEQSSVEFLPEAVGLYADTFGGRVHVEWDPSAAATPLGQLPFFVEFLKLGGLFDPWVGDCPLTLTSPNAAAKRDILGTLLLAVLAGHQRYAHITALRGDAVNAALLGMHRVMSEDSVRRALARIDEAAGVEWLQRHLDYTFRPLLGEPWILDVDTTVKPLYGRQEGAVVGYNPHKPGRPSHTYHTYAIAELRLMLEVEVQAGNQHASKHSAPGLWALLARLGRAAWPRLLRGDCDWGTEANMSRAEREGLPYLFKLRLTRNAKRLIERAMVEPGWLDAGHGWQGKQSTLRLVGWSRHRRVILLRRPIERAVAMVTGDGSGRQLDLYFGEITSDPATKVFEYAVLVTSLANEVLTVAGLYRDRATGENNFDELKNHWGWGGFTTRDLQRCRLMARIVALIYNWWTLFVRLADPSQHTEAITSRPLLLYSVGRQTRHANQTTITITSTHGKAGHVRRMLAEIVTFFKSLRPIAEQLSDLQRWHRILSRALVKYLKGRQLGPPPIPLPA